MRRPRPARMLVILLTVVALIDATATATVFVVSRNSPPPMPRFSTSGVHPQGAVDTYLPLSPVYGYTTSPQTPLAADDAGHVTYTTGGRTVLNPDVNAGYALAALAAYAEAKDERWLQRAETAIRDVLETSRDGLFPHDYPAYNSLGQQLPQPWYSAQTQGLVLSVLVRLDRITGEATWQRAADRVFATFLTFRDYSPDQRPPPDPWISLVDGSGYLWFEKHPQAPDPTRVVNAHLTALVGIYDYSRIAPTTSISRAVDRLFDGGVTTIAHYLPEIRVPGELSRVTMTSDAQDPVQHQILITQLRALAKMSGEQSFARAAAALQQDTPPLTFRTSGLTPDTAAVDAYLPLPPVYGYETDPQGPIATDDSGHVTYTVDGNTILYPDVSAGYALAALATYARTNDERWVRRAETAVRDVMATSADGLLPHDFPDVNALGQPVGRPWYSAQAQGLMLSALVRLHEVTGDDVWRTEADRVFATLTTVRGYSADAATGVWMGVVDDDGYLWFEKHPQGPVPTYVVSAHLTALIGVYDYWRMTRDPVAARLVDGGATTVAHYLPIIRKPGGTSRYSLSEDSRDPHQHDILVAQLGTLAKVTGSPVFTRYARLLAQDQGPQRSGS